MQIRHEWRAIWKAWLAFALVLATAMAMAGCHRTPAEEAIRNAITAMQAAGEARDVDGVLAPLADDFVGSGDEAGGEPLDRKNFGRFLHLILLREPDIKAHLGPITVTLQGTDRATVDFTMVVTGGHGLLPSDGRMEQVHTGWRLESGDWKLISADWKQGGAPQ